MPKPQNGKALSVEVTPAKPTIHDKEAQGLESVETLIVDQSLPLVDVILISPENKHAPAVVPDEAEMLTELQCEV